MKNQCPAFARPRSAGGFTLVELLVVFGIIGLLLAITIPSLSSMQAASMRAMSLTTISTIERGCEMYRNDFGEYPPSYWQGQISWVSGMQGRYMLVQWLTGYKDGSYNENTNTLSGDGHPGYGFRVQARGMVRGPYNDCEKLPRPATGTPVFVDSFGNEIYYYRFDTRMSGSTPVTGYHAVDNSNTYSPPASGGLITSCYSDLAKKKYFRQDFILLSAGPDGKFVNFTDTANKGYQTDDITNFLPE